MEPDGYEEMPEPTGVTINLNPDRVIAALQRRAATLIQNLQWELATRDAVVEVLEERLHESEQLREEAEGAMVANQDDRNEAWNDVETLRTELEEAREQIAKLTKGQQDLLREREDLIKQQVTELEGLSPQGEALRDAFLEAETLTVQPGPAAEPSPEET